MLDPSQNHGWMLQGAASSLLSGSWVNFGSRESGAPPRLLLDLGADVDMQACAESVKPRDDLVGAARERAYQAEIIRRCIDPGASACLNELRAQVNVDYFATASALISRTITPAAFLAVDRDREKKARAFELDPARAAALCAGDSDGDYVPNGIDACPATPALTPTDAFGCTDSTQPPAPPASAVAADLDKLGFTFNAACTKVTVLPKASQGTLYRPAALGAGVFVFVGRVTNQPVGCPVWYLIEVEDYRLSGSPPVKQSIGRYSVAFKDSEEVTSLAGLPIPVPRTLIQFNARAGDPGTRGRLGGSIPPAAAQRYRVQVVNGGGMKSGWSEWHEPSPSDCDALGIYCGQ